MGFRRSYFSTKYNVDIALPALSKFKEPVLRSAQFLKNLTLSESVDTKTNLFYNVADLSKDEIFLLFYSCLENPSFEKLARRNSRSYILDGMFSKFYVDLLEQATIDEVSLLRELYLDKDVPMYHTPSELHLAFLLSIHSMLDLHTEFIHKNLFKYFNVSYIRNRLKRKLAPDQFKALFP